MPRIRASAARCWAAVLLLLVLALASAAPAQGYLNGRYPPSALSPIYFADHGEAKLAKGARSASWNTMNLCAAADGVPLSPGPSSYRPAATAYRSYAVQVILKRVLGRFAATAGYSNHGIGRAVDLRNLNMQRWVIRHGAPFGWTWGEVRFEWWHVTFGRLAVASFHRPDPGGSFRYPNLQRGSGGRCQAPAVKEVQRRLGVHQDGEYGKATSTAVVAFQRSASYKRSLKRHHLHHDPRGRVRSTTWIALREYSRGVTHGQGGGSTVGTVHGKPEAGQDVRAIEGLINARLNELHLGGLKVRVDGLFAAAETRAVKKLQHRFHLKVTGKVDPRTYAALRKPRAKATAYHSVDAAGAQLVASFEGYYAHPYRDVVGVLTIGYGHTGADTRRLDPLSRVAAIRLLQKDLGRFAAAVIRVVHVHLSQQEFDAYVSFSYNVGAGAFGSSTLLHLLNAGHHRAACQQLPRWNRAGGRVFAGLTRRRLAEERMCLRGAG